jgi:hypothetical protein
MSNRFHTDLFVEMGRRSETILKGCKEDTDNCERFLFPRLQVGREKPGRKMQPEMETEKSQGVFLESSYECDGDDDDDDDDNGEGRKDGSS